MSTNTTGEAQGTIVTSETSSTHPAFNGARVKVVTRGFPITDLSAWMLVEFLDDLPKVKAKKGHQIEIRTRDFQPDRLASDTPANFEHAIKADYDIAGDTQDVPPERDDALARNIIKRISDAALELAFVRHSLTSDEVDCDDDATVKEQVAATEAFCEEVKEDTFNVLVGDETGCLDESDLDETNCELLWLQSQLDTAEGLAEALRLILPLAKGYVFSNNVGSNAAYIREAEAALAKYEGPKS